MSPKKKEIVLEEEVVVKAPRFAFFYCEMCDQEFKVATCEVCGQPCDHCRLGILEDHRLEKHQIEGASYARKARGVKE